MLDWMKEKEGRFLSHKEGEDFFEKARRGLSIWFDVKEPIELFTGREGESESLHKVVQDNVNKGTVISQITSVSGLGGIGKSELIRKYIQKHSQDYDSNVIWINAENYETLVQSFTRLAKDKLNIVMEDGNGKLKEIKSIVEDVYRYFVKQRSLFIFDNAERYRTTEEEKGIDDFLSKLPTDANKPYILITSRNQVWGNIKVIQLGIFNEPEAIEFIKKALKIKDNAQDQNVARLAETLQRFPLALQQAVTYIRQADEEVKNVSHERGFTINDYLKEYKEKEKELLDFPFQDDSSHLYTKTTFTTWKVTIDKIKKNKKYGNKL
ncbi:MAG: hypothetical protein PG981_000688 [Wolbachia endosymbiont of Ctenocephalides orientis wCori]|nr:MAG: hypothetical protein PG981_000688 [Wolbachia endosymbiont of Ctenocephalides orientis wCori]